MRRAAIRAGKVGLVYQAHELYAPDGFKFVDVSAQSNYSCALDSSGTVRCFGANMYNAAPATLTATTGTFGR